MMKDNGKIIGGIVNNSYFMMLLCILPMIILFAGSYIFGWKNNLLLGFAMFATCMLSHIFMMRSHNHSNH